MGPEKNSKRPRLSIDVKPEVQNFVQAAAQAEGISINIYGQESLQMRMALHELLEAGIASIALKNAAGESVLEFPTTVFERFLLSNPVLKAHLLKQNPNKPQ